MLSYLHALHVLGSVSKSSCFVSNFMEASFRAFQEIAEIGTEFGAYALSAGTRITAVILK